MNVQRKIIILLILAISIITCTPVMMVDRAKVEQWEQIKKRMIQEIRRFYGAPYQWGGDTPRGVDCSGMVKMIYKNAVGVDLPHNAHEMFKWGISIRSSQLDFGDLVFFSTSGNRITHTGIYVAKGYFVHASTSRGVTIDHLDETYYRTQFVGARRLIDH